MLNFLGIGAQKCGTTWLYKMLQEHPDIIFPAGKEMYFWNAEDYQQRIEWYQDVFKNHDQVSGEITPGYALLSDNRIAKIAQLYPELRLIYIIRNPIDRAWSSALMALKRAEMHIDEASDQWFIDHFQSQGSLQRGDYGHCIKAWRAHYAKEQLLILNYKEIALQPRALLRRCCTHLNVSQLPFDHIAHSLLTKKIFAGTGEPIRPTLRPILEKIYPPKTHKFEDYLR